MSEVTPPAGDLPPTSTPAVVRHVPDRFADTEPPPPLPRFAEVETGPKGPTFAGFWRRAWARFVTTLYWTVLGSLGTFGIVFAFTFLYSASNEAAFLLAGLVCAWIFGIFVTYMVWSRSLSTRRGTVGMRQMGLAIRSRGSRVTAISRAQAFRRSALTFVPFVYASGASWIVLYSPSVGAIALTGIIGAALFLLLALGGLWMLVSPERQTAWDVVGDTVVMAEREPSWLALGSFVAGLVVPGVAWAITVGTTGLDDVRDQFDDMRTVGDMGEFIVSVIPGLAVSLAAVVIGHIALRPTSWDRGGGRAGRGLARTGLALSYLFPVGIVLTSVFGVTVNRINEREIGTCEEIREDLELATASYTTLNGRPPTDLATLGSPIYIDVPDLADRFEIETLPGGEVDFVGVGDCDDL